MDTTIINPMRPGLLVNMSTALKGNTSYRVNQLGEIVAEDGSIVTEWETERTTRDPAEHAEAIKTRTKIRGLILKVCVTTAFSNVLLCPNSKEPELREAIAEGERLRDEFNAQANVTRIGFHVYVGRIAQDDEMAIKSITSEIRQLMDEMQQGLVQLDVEAVRDAANKAQAMSGMLARNARMNMQTAIDAARASATATKKLAKAGEAAAREIDSAAIARIDKARTAFLDIEEAIDAEQIEIRQPVMSGVALDL
jgi:hypothetical protein